MPPRVLLVDPDARWRALLARWLRLEGYAVTTAARGRAALDTLSREAWDVVFVHANLPDLQAGRLIRRLRRRAQRTFVVLIEGDADTARQVGFGCAVLPRPWKSSELACVVLQARAHARAVKREQHLGREFTLAAASAGRSRRSRG